MSSVEIPRDRNCFIKFCTSATDLRSLREAIQLGTPQHTLRERIHEVVIAKQSHVSVYLSENRDLDSLGHVIAVVAFVIGSSDFDSDPTPKQRGSIPKRKGGTVKLDEVACKEKLTMEETPDGCTTLHIGKRYHWDIVIEEDVSLVLDFVMDQMRNSDTIILMEPAKAGSNPSSFSRQASVRRLADAIGFDLTG